MANNRLVITGIEDYRNIPRELASAADPIIRAGADRARAKVQAAYPVVTGRLRRGVVVETRGTSDAGVADAVVRSTAPYAEIFEFGSQRAGGQRARSTFLPITATERHATTRAIVALVKAAGFTVTGE